MVGSRGARSLRDWLHPQQTFEMIDGGAEEAFLRSLWSHCRPVDLVQVVHIQPGFTADFRHFAARGTHTNPWSSRCLPYGAGAIPSELSLLGELQWSVGKGKSLKRARLPRKLSSQRESTPAALISKGQDPAVGFVPVEMSSSSTTLSRPSTFGLLERSSRV